MYQCPECGKEYGSKSGLRRHRKRDHALAQIELVDVAKRPGVFVVQTTEVEPEEREPEPGVHEQVGAHAAKRAWARGESKADVKVLFAALKALGIEDHNVMAWKVYPDRVVIIEGPVGYKRIWNREE